MSSKAVKEKLVWEGDGNSVGGERSSQGGVRCACAGGGDVKWCGWVPWRPDRGPLN